VKLVKRHNPNEVYPTIHVTPASHKSNPSNVTHGYVDLYSTLHWVTSEVVTGVEGYHDDKRWLKGLWSTQANVECVLKAALHWGGDCIVVTDPLGGTRPHPIVCRPSVRVGLRFPRFSWEGSIIGDSDGY
jgi:hypothetical protein